MSKSTAAKFAVSFCLAMAATTTFAAAQETEVAAGVTINPGLVSQ